MDLVQRPRRLRRTGNIRKLVRETRISESSLILPFFVREGSGIREEIPSMPGQIRYSPDTLWEGIQEAQELGIHNFLLFGIPEYKDEIGTSAWIEDGVIQQALRGAREKCPEATLITDVCLCEYTSHGHCGVLDCDTVNNDETLPLLAKTALSHVQAGADIVAPSDMMDGRVGAIRQVLDQAGHINIPVMSYAAKYASTFYGPFREAAGSVPSFGDRNSYQMDYHNAKEAVMESLLDMEEGADIFIVKPALSYLDIISKVSENIDRPIAAYSVSGEYAMIKAAGAQGLIDEYGMILESAVSIYRAGADILITYFAKELAQAIKKGDIG